MSQRLNGSFRDPHGHIYTDLEGRLLRQVNRVGAEDYELFKSSGLQDDLWDQKLLVRHREIGLDEADTPCAAYVLEPERIPFISYPYEWPFSALKDAALLTLDVAERSLNHGMVLKDASAYNVQLVAAKPIFIDTLSFSPYKDGSPWVAYGQFCRQFLAPLALMSKIDARLGLLMRNFLDGIPLDLAHRMLPVATRFSPGLAMHIHMHGKASSSEGVAVKRNATVSLAALRGLLDSLKGTIEGLQYRAKGTVWGDYYSQTNYSAQAMDAKQKVVLEMAKSVGKVETIWDLGANTGEFSRVVEKLAATTIAWDMDPAAVEKNYLSCKNSGGKILPLVNDLTNPSPGIGWNLNERMSLDERGPADLALALALVHHLAIGNNVPLEHVAEFFHKMARNLIIEFVPKGDSQVERMLSSREDIFVNYDQKGFEEAFREWFSIEQSVEVPGTCRTLYRMVAKG